MRSDVDKVNESNICECVFYTGRRVRMSESEIR